MKISLKLIAHSLIAIYCMGLTGCDNKESKTGTLVTDGQKKVLNEANIIEDKLLDADKERLKKLDEEGQ